LVVLILRLTNVYAREQLNPMVKCPTETALKEIQASCKHIPYIRKDIEVLKENSGKLNNRVGSIETENVNQNLREAKREGQVSILKWFVGALAIPIFILLVRAFIMKL